MSGGILAVGLAVPWVTRLIVESRYAEAAPGWSRSLFRAGDLDAGVWNALPFAALAWLAWTIPRSWSDGGVAAVPKVCAVAIAFLALVGFSLNTHLGVWSKVILQEPGWSTASVAVFFGSILSFMVLLIAYVVGYAAGWLARTIGKAFS